MNDEEAMDARLGALLRGADRAPDEAFLMRVERVLAAERQMEVHRRAAWRRFAGEAVASAAVAAAFILLGRSAPAAGELDLAIASPLPAAGLLLILWLVVAFRPAVQGR
jgi:Na+-transporting NADH:ubiquinone oxidoreductase subunit NqrB